MENITTSEAEPSTEIFIGINCGIIILTFLINGFTIMIFSVQRSLLETVFNRVLLSLAVCDFISGIIMSIDIHENLTPSLRNLSNETAIIIRVTSDIFSAALVKCAVLHLLCIAIDRYIGLFYALRYTDIVTPHLANVSIISSWLLCAVLALIPITWLYHLVDGISADEEIWISRYDAWYSITSIVIFMFIPLTSFLVLFIKMFLEIKRLLASTPHASSNSTNHYAEQLRSCRMFAAMLTAFSVLSIPYYTTRLINDLSNLNYWDIQLNELTYELSYLMRNLSLLSNLLLYILCNKEFRRATRRVFRRWKITLMHVWEDARRKMRSFKQSNTSIDLSDHEERLTDNITKRVCVELADTQLLDCIAHL